MQDNKSPLLIPLIVAVAITLILGVILVGMELSGGKSGIEDTTEAQPETTPSPLFSADLEEYETYMDAKDEKYLVIVNKEHTIGEDYEPEELVKVKDARKEIYLSKTAELALEAMFCEMRAQGFDSVFVTSAYRSYSYQQSLFNTYINAEMSKGLSYEEAKEKVLTYSALPGTSEHHTGLCVDLMHDGMTELDESFADYPVYDWLLENSWKFGFILRYPKDKTDVTKYDFEPWHYRFVGRYHAYKIHQNNLCLEEY